MELSEKKANMPNRSKEQWNRGGGTAPGFSKWRSGLYPIAASVVLIVFIQSACSKKSTVNLAPTSSVKVALLPFNVPEKAGDLRWTALAAPIMMEKVSRQAPDLEIIPFWQTMPVTIQTAGKSRTITQETAASVSSWISAKWAVMGELKPTPKGVSMMIDFIPSKSTMIAFRYMKEGKMDWIESGMNEAFQQFLRYLIARPLEPETTAKQNPDSLHNLAEALDREYGWFADPQPGKSQEIVADLLKTDRELARFLFNPDLYPALKTK